MKVNYHIINWNYAYKYFFYKAYDTTIHKSIYDSILLATFIAEKHHSTDAVAIEKN